MIKRQHTVTSAAADASVVAAAEATVFPVNPLAASSSLAYRPASAPPLSPGEWSVNWVSDRSGNPGSQSSSSSSSNNSNSSETPSLPSLQSLAAAAAVSHCGTSAEALSDAGYPLAAVASVAQAEASIAAAASSSEQALTVEGVHELLVRRCGVPKSHLERVNPCLKRALLKGHLVLPPPPLPPSSSSSSSFSSSTESSSYPISDYAALGLVVCTDGCVSCGKMHTCTLEKVLWQSPYGGDYEEGGQDGAVQCRGDRGGADEEEEDEEEEDYDEYNENGCCGNYVTGLCQGQPRFDSGKFHNHCTQCEDFGVCLGDYREAHCERCGTHYFAGMSGFACPGCRGGKGKSKVALQDMPPPPRENFNGIVEGSDALLKEATSARMREVMSAMGLGVSTSESGDHGGGDNDDDDDQRAAMMAMMTSMLAANAAGGEGGSEEGSSSEGLPQCPQS